MRRYRADVRNRVGFCARSAGAVVRHHQPPRNGTRARREKLVGSLLRRETLDENLFHHVKIRLVMVMIVMVVIVRQVWRLPLGCMRRCPVIVPR